MISYVRLLDSRNQAKVSGPQRNKHLQRFVYRPAAGDIKGAWDQERIPTINLRSVERKVGACYVWFQKTNKLRASCRALKIKALKKEAEALFDIAACRCELPLSCSCSRSNNVPQEEVAFLMDQRTKR